MPEGRVIQAIGGFYQIFTEHCEIVTARARGKIRLGDGIVVGDIVKYQSLPGGQGVIEEVRPRKTMLKKPNVSNVDQMIVVFSFQEPEYSALLIDRFLLMAEVSLGMEILLIFNKQDLVSESAVKEVVRAYQEVGYKVISTSAITGMGRSVLLGEIGGKASVFSGPSGVGKSALLNMVSPDFALQTGEVSKRIGRGQHTTRHIQLLPLPDRSGFVLDTPGFTQFEPELIPSTSLARYFPDIHSFTESCRFTGCLHHHEPGCAVREAVERKALLPWRYEHYLQFLTEIKEQEETKYCRKKKS